MTLWAPSWNSRVDSAHPPHCHSHGDVITRLCSVKQGGQYLHLYPLPCHCQVQSPGPPWQLKNPTFRQQAGEMQSSLMFLLMGVKKRKSEAFRIDFYLLVSYSFHLCEQKITAQQEEGKKNLYSWQALRQSWIIYLFCNSFLSNILFLSLAIKNWNASFSVNVLVLTICLTLDKLFNLSKPVFLSIGTAPDTM